MTESPSTADKVAELERLRARVASLEAEVAAELAPGGWPPRGYYTTYYLMSGMVLGLIAAAASLLFNIIGATMFGMEALKLIRVYLTFPMGQSALTLDSAFALAAGCCLYLGTGMIGGIPFHMILTRYFSDASAGKRFIVASVLGLGVWIINYYCILSWLQPALIGGNWIVEEIPFYVAAMTHLIFGWTMLLVAQWGEFVQRPVARQEKRS